MAKGRRSKRGRFDVQELYDNGKLLSDEFYIGCTNIIKTRLMRDLVYKGYYKNGIKQSNYDLEDVNDCYTYIMTKIKEKYDPAKGKIATFIRNWVQGYGTTVISKQKRQHKRLGKILPLDLTLQTSISDDLRDSTKIENLEDMMDTELYGNNYGDNLEPPYVTVADIERIEKEVREDFWQVS